LIVMKALRALFVLALLPVAAAAQGRLGSEFRVNAHTTGNQASPAVAATVSGGFVVVWTSYEQDGSDGGVFARRVNGSGTPLGGDILVNSYTTDRQISPAVASDAVGNFVVVWLSPHDGDNLGVFGQRFTATGVLRGTEFQVNTYTTGLQGDVKVASDADGNFIVVWGGVGPSDTSGIYARRYASTGAPVGSQFALTDSTIGIDQRPDVVLDETGRFTAVHGRTSSGSLDVFAREFGPSGAPLGNEFRVNTYTTDQQWFPSVAWRPDGGFTAVWNSNGQDGPRGVFYRAFFPGGLPWNPTEFRVNVLTGGSHFIPRVAADVQGNFSVVWYADSHDGSNRGVALLHFLYPGMRGPEFVVNSYTFGAQESPAVATDANGNFMVVWRSSGQDGDIGGIFAQRFSPERIFADGFE
jgi:hypothetical protein